MSGFREPCVFGEGESYYDTMTGEVDYGFMYHGITYAEEAVLDEDKGKMTVRFWKPVMKKGGIIEFLKTRGVYPEKDTSGKCSARSSENGNFNRTRRICR